ALGWLSLRGDASLAPSFSSGPRGRIAAPAARAEAGANPGPGGRRLSVRRGRRWAPGAEGGRTGA
ncbi:hypothetical protein P7K49_022072, partial [Saguinus oedipus]